MSTCNQESHKTSKNCHIWTRIDQPTNQNSQTQTIKSQSWLIKGFEWTTIQLQLPTKFNYKYHNQQDKPKIKKFDLPITGKKSRSRAKNLVYKSSKEWTTWLKEPLEMERKQEVLNEELQRVPRLKALNSSSALIPC